MQAERQLKDDKMIFSNITVVVTFNIINNIKALKEKDIILVKNSQQNTAPGHGGSW